MAKATIIHQLRSQSRLFNSRIFQSGYQTSRFGAWTHPPIPNHNHIPAFQLATTQKRWASQGSTAANNYQFGLKPRKGTEPEEHDNNAGTAYEGPISTVIKRVKLLSLSTCCLSVSLGPVITFMTSTDSNVILKGAVASSVIFFSASTTGLLHWFASPYIHKIKWQPGSDTFEVYTMTWLATLAPKTIKFADVRHADTNRPYVSFMANDIFYFVDEDACHNKALLAKLTPQKSTHESAFKNL